MARATPGGHWRFLVHSEGGKKSHHIDSEISHRAALAAWKRVFGEEPYPIADAQVIRGSPIFDELIVDDWLHIEQMDTRVWWMSVGNGERRTVITVRISGTGDAVVTVSED